MKKLLVFVAVLALLAGTAYAAALDDGLTRQVWAHAKGRSVVSDGSVALRIWYTGSGPGTISISPSSVNLYDNGVVTQASLNTYSKLVDLVDYIDGLSTWEAVLGPDARDGDHFSGGTPGKIPLSANVATAGTSKESPTYVYVDSSTAYQLSAGVEGTDGKTNRIKEITSSYSINTAGGAQVVTVLVYDGDNLVWRESVNTSAYNSATSPHASPNTISFVNYTDKGIAGSQGKSLVAYVSGSTATMLGSVDKLSDHNISILYDQF